MNAHQCAILIFVLGSAALYSASQSSSLVESNNTKVSVGLYYSALCPQWNEFVINNLSEVVTSNEMMDIVNLTFVPFGNEFEPTTDVVTCQHGELGCKLNIVQSCVIHFYPSLSQHFPFILCMAEYAIKKQETKYEECYKKLGIDPKQINECQTSGLGNKLESKYIDATEDLQALVYSVPWVTVNNRPVFYDYENLMGYICKIYLGAKTPKTCTRFQSFDIGLWASEHTYIQETNVWGCFRPEDIDEAENFDYAALGFLPGSWPKSNKKVSVELYYETLCPQWSVFILKELSSLIKDDEKMKNVNLTFIPYGNSQRSSNSTTIVCEHGDMECKLNKIQACIIDIVPSSRDHFRFIRCVAEHAHRMQENDFEECYDNLDGAPIDTKLVNDCYNSSRGDQLVAHYANVTENLKPPHMFVPWVIVDKRDLQLDYKNVVGYICKSLADGNSSNICNDSFLWDDNNVRKEDIGCWANNLTQIAAHKKSWQ